MFAEHSAGLVALSEWLGTYALHSTVLLFIGLTAARWAGGSRAARRLLGVAMVAAPLTTTIVLSSADPTAAERSVSSTPAAPQIVPAATPDLAVPPVSEDAAQRVSGRRVPPARLVGSTRIRLSGPHAWAELLASAWMLLAGLGCVRFLIGTARRVRGIERTVTSFPPGLNDELAERVRLRHPGIRLATTEKVIEPLAIYPSTVVMPSWAARELSVTELEAVFDHERAHLARHDPLWAVLHGLLATAFFFQPLQRIAATRFAELSEWVADESAARSRVAGHELARSIIRVAERVGGQRSRGYVPGLVGRSDPPLTTRVRLLVEGTGAHRRTSLLAGHAVLVAALAITLGVGLEVTASPALPGSLSARPSEASSSPASSATAAEGADRTSRWVSWSTEAIAWPVASSTVDLRDVEGESRPDDDRLWILVRTDGAGVADGVWMSTRAAPRIRDDDVVVLGEISNDESLAAVLDLRGRSASFEVRTELGAAVAIHADWTPASAAARSILRDAPGEGPEELIQWLARRPSVGDLEDAEITTLLQELTLRGYPDAAAVEAVDGLGQRARRSPRARTALGALVDAGGDAMLADEAAEWLSRLR